MGMMNKLRDNTGVILWILVFSFGGLWVLQDSGVFDTIGFSGANIAEVNGEAIAYDAYSRAINNQIQQYQAQSDEALGPQAIDNLRESVFNALVEDRLREQEMDRLGIQVTDDEVRDMVLGDEPHPIVKVYFGDGQGGVNRTLLQSFIDNPDQTEQLVQLEDYLRAQRRQEKLENLVESTVRVSDIDVQEEYLKRNRKVDASFVALPYAAVPDDSIQITERDLRQFYDAHKEDYARKRTYTIDYAMLSKEPSAEDSTLLKNELGRLEERFAAADEDSLFLARNASERPFTDAFFRADELDAPIADDVFPDPEVGKVYGPLFSGGLIHLIKVTAVQPSEQPSVHARHILFRANEGNPAERTEARQRAESVKQRIEAGEDFAALAREFSQDPSNAQQGGDLGWFGNGRMVKPFEDAVLGARLGRVIGPVETEFGYHLVEVLARADQEVQLADLAQRVRPDVATLNGMQDRLGDLSYYAGESGSFQEEAERLGLPVQQEQVVEDQRVIPGLGVSQTVMNFLNRAKPGTVSDVIELNDAYIVVHLSDVQSAGYRPLEDVTSEVETRVKLDKKRAIQAAKLRAALQNNEFDGLAQALGTTQRQAPGITFNTTVIPSLGREPKFNGTALGMKEGDVSGVIEGDNAAFVIKANSVSEPSPITDAEREQLKQQLLTQRRNQLTNEWLTSLRESAEIEDYRLQFQQQ